ncbi:MAG: endoglucanase A [Chlorobia bacterium]|nr:endoglucanase A [Fimbriimonadaceae bacterium]
MLLVLAFGQRADITIDATKSKPISPYIYGVNHPDWDKMGSGFTLARQGGNRMTAYNWETNASNAGSDWHHQNDGFMGESNEPGLAVRTFLEGAQKHGAAAIITVPTAGYVSADKKGDGDVNKTPDYLNKRFFKSQAKKNGAWAFPPNTSDHAVYQDEFVAWIEKIRSAKTPVWFSLDNEPDLWGHTHQRIWPKNPTYAQIIANNIEFATGIKSAAPKSLVFGPANYGWMGFRTFQGAPDANGRDFLDVYLTSMKDAQGKAGKRLVDVLDIHWYPEAQGGGIRICFGDGKNDKPETQTARIQAPRSLWDPTYVEDSWITKSVLQGKPISLLPGVLGQIDKNYPGTKLAITEYSYGGPNHISGAIAQADVLGIFGRYGLFAATNWGLNANNRAELAGFHAFTNFDGKGSRFGDLGLRVTGESAASESVYASLDSKAPGRMVVVAINKTKSKRSFSLSFNGFAGKRATGYYLSDGSFEKAGPLAISALQGRQTFDLPAESIATIEIRS